NMNIAEIIQNVATVGAVILGIVYIIGGLIVNLNLTRRGVVEYQILKVKYLAVGMIFLVHFLGIVLFTIIPSALIASLSADDVIVQTLSIPSILAALALLYPFRSHNCLICLANQAVV
ncbi:MAG TPA: hypothetical protein VK249_20865, partial [Anaerolineales bacterium]|nr:hypothetical protein [Anaerolineales bacterium]